MAWVNLSTGQIDYLYLPEEWRYAYLGGRGLNSRLLYELTGPDTDPLGEDNPLLFSTGPLTGTMIPTNGRYTVSARSPLTGILGDGNAAGFWAPELKYAGFDTIAITGRAEKPVYLWIHNGRVEIRAAESLWGKDTWEATAALQAVLGADAQVAVIGPAGEHRVKYACIINNLGRAVGRTGMGAVMGAKRLKSVAVRGTLPVAVAHPAEHRQVVDEMLRHIYAAPGYLMRSRYGTTAITDVYLRLGTLPVNNAQAGSSAEAVALTADRVAAHTQGLKACFACPIHCSRFTRVESGAGGEGPEYETIVALGARCGNYDLPSVIKMNQLANRLGLDTISAGGVISFLMECRQRGLVGPEQTDNLDLTWGNHAAMAELLPKIAYREGCGDWLAEGVRSLSRDIPGSADFAIHVKGLETAEQEPRGMKAWGLGWAVSSRGGDHLRAFPLAETTWTKEEARRVFGSEQVADPTGYAGKDRLVKWSEEVSAVTDSLELCKFCQMALTVPLELTARALWTVTGWEAGAADLLTIGERIVNLERMYNGRLGLGRADDRLPGRFAEPLTGGVFPGQTFDLGQMLGPYYRARGWDEATGYPRREKLEELGLGFTVPDLGGSRS